MFLRDAVPKPGRKETIVLGLYYSNFMLVLCFILFTLILLPTLISLVVYLVYFLASLFHRSQSRDLTW